MQIEKQKIKSRIHLLKAFEDVYKRENKYAKTKKRKESTQKKLEDISLAIELSKASLDKKRREKKQSIAKRCLMCGESTKNPSGFCDRYSGSAFGCKEQWYEEYKTPPTKKELNAKWRDDLDE